MYFYLKIGNIGCRNVDLEVLFGMICSFKKLFLNWLFLIIFVFDNWIKWMYELYISIYVF